MTLINLNFSESKNLHESSKLAKFGEWGDLGIKFRGKNSGPLKKLRFLMTTIYIPIILEWR